ncbi:MAG: phosphoenolpyruvate carboxykinase [Alphaproteobacteria bacterium]|nr:phosphoenolpyruvate carboxykinase [Alphaproteobacteria bacterium]
MQALRSKFGLDQNGLTNVAKEHWNLTVPQLYEYSIRAEEGIVGDGGAISVETGEHTGRSVNDKFVVKEPANEGNIWWGKVNQPFAADKFASIYRRMLAYLQGREVFVLDSWAGADPTYRLPVRLITESAWHCLFSRNMFIRPTADEHADFTPKFTIVHAPGFKADPKTDGTRSEVFILMNFAERVVLIGGTSYAGEIKKSVFTLLNYLLPAQSVLPMHCSVNLGEKGDAALFFGLSGTGKTTLSADPTRRLVGDDEHGWSDRGLFNFEGGCYAKVINLSPEQEPEIFAATHMFGTVLENVAVDPVTRKLNLADGRLTENTRASYPLSFIPRTVIPSVAGHPDHVVMLTADAFGVLPPIAQLSAAQAMYHFLSGYTAKVAGTEKGLAKEPQATFSTCFGAPFMPRHPTVYAKMLGERIARHGAKCWLVNTGWTSGSYGVGHRMPINHTRALLRAAIDGTLAGATMRQDRAFGFRVPEACPDVPIEIMSPRETWRDKAAYDAVARTLVSQFHANFTQFESYVGNEVKSAAPKAAYG